MPWYDFECNHCGHEYDVICSIENRDDRSDTVSCPECGSSDVHRLPSCGSFVMDGKMSVRHPNSPDGMQRAKEIKKKYWKQGKKAHDEWVSENKARHERDGKWGYSE